MVGMRRMGKPSMKEGKENSMKVRKEPDGSASLYSKFSGVWRKIGLNVLTSPSKGSLSLFAGRNEIYHDSRLLFYGDVLDFNCALKLGDINAATSDTDKFLVSDSGNIKYRTGTEVLSDIGASATTGDSGIVTTGELNSGSIATGFGNINNGSSTITTTGAISGGSFNHFLDVKIHQWYATNGAQDYIPFGASQVETNLITDAYNDDTLFIAPYAGTLEFLKIQCATGVGATAGSTAIALRVAGTTKTAVTATIGNEATQTFSWSGNNTFSAGDRIRISFDPSSAPKYVTATSVWKYSI